MRKGKFLSPQAARFIEIADPDFFNRPQQNGTAERTAVTRSLRSRKSNDLTGHDESLA
jgi:hypothetical protein